MSNMLTSAKIRIAESSSASCAGMKELVLKCVVRLSSYFFPVVFHVTNKVVFAEIAGNVRLF